MKAELPNIMSTPAMSCASSESCAGLTQTTGIVIVVKTVSCYTPTIWSKAGKQEENVRRTEEDKQKRAQLLGKGLSHKSKRAKLLARLWTGCLRCSAPGTHTWSRSVTSTLK